MSGFIDLLKYNPLVVNLYDSILDGKCRTVDGFVFVATTGRSGSQSLSKIFQAADDAVCFHEPYPIMASDYPDPETKQAYFRHLFHSRKRINVKRAAAGHRYYVETNHQFIKNYAEMAIEEFGDKLRVLHISRDPLKVAASFYAIDSIPGKTRTGRAYLLYPDHRDNLLQMGDLLLGDPEFEHDLYKCLWYWYEIEARVKATRQKFPQVRWHSMKTEQLNDKQALVQMFEALAIVHDPERLDALVGSRVNTKTELKKKAVDLKEVEDKNDRLVRKMEERYGEGFWK
ncbi:hypothetical protein KQH82_12305 [bacterium]|nr:hypothetical protein [bacterium]